MHRLRVLYVIDSLAAGGAERSLADIAPHLRERKIDLHVVPIADVPGVQEELTSAGATVHPSVGSRSITSLRALRDTIARVGPDLVHTTLFEADVFGRIAAVTSRRPVVTTLANAGYGAVHGSSTGQRVRLRGAQVVDAASARVCRRFHAVSESVAHTMARRLWLPARKIDVVHRGRDAAKLGVRTAERRASARRALGIDDRKPVVLALARHEWQKGLDVLVAAWGQVVAGAPEAELLVAGREGNQTAALRDAIRRGGHERSVRFLGARTDAPDLLVASDVVVVPSRHEGLPGVVIEALALETPLVATDIPPVHEVVGASDSALIVPVEDAPALGSAILEAIDDGARTARMTAAGRERFLEEFTIERAATAMVAFYDRSLA